MIQVPAKETQQEERRGIRAYNVAEIYYTGRVHPEILQSETIRSFTFLFFLSLKELQIEFLELYFSISETLLLYICDIFKGIAHQVRHAVLNAYEARSHLIYRESPLR